MELRKYRGEYGMDYIHRLPFILSISMTIVTGAISLERNIQSNKIYVRMLISTVVFFVIGIYIRSVLNNISDEIKKNRQELKRQKEFEQRQADPSQGVDGSTSEVDYRVGDDDDDDFVPLDVTHVSKDELTK